MDGFSDVDPNAISSKYFLYMLANTGDNGEPIAMKTIVQKTLMIIKLCLRNLDN